MADQGLNIKVGADVSDAVDGVNSLTKNIQQLENQLASAEKELTAVGRAIDQAIAKGQDISKLEDAFQETSDKVKALRQQIASIQPPSVNPGSLQPLNDSITKLSLNTRTARLGFVDLFRAIDGDTFSPRALAANFALLGPAGLVAGAALVGLIDILSHQTDAEKKAAQAAQDLQDKLQALQSADDINTGATGSTQGEIARVQDLAAAVRNTNKSYEERQRALEELQSTNKSYFGDLTLEADSMKTLASRVQDYAQALVTEAIIKSQTDAIAKQSQEYLAQVKVLNQLKDAMTAAQAEAAKPQASSAGNVAGGGADDLNNSAMRAADAAVTAYHTQLAAVTQLKDQINEYNESLNDNIQLQLKQRPLEVVKPEDVKSIDSILSKIREVKAELAKPQEGALFKLNQQSGDQDIAKLYETKIADAIQSGAKIGTQEAGQYAAELANLYAQQLKRIQNPDLHAHIQGIVDVRPTEFDKLESEVEKQFGAKEIKVKIPLGLDEDLKNQGFNKQEVQELLKKSTEDAANGVPTIRWTPKIEIIVNTATLKASFQKQLTESLNATLSSAASSGLDNIGKAIGASLAKGTNPIQAAGEAILSTIGGLIEQMGEALVKYGVETELVRDVLSGGLNIAPGVAIAAGIAMIAAGELVKKSFKVPAFAEGGVVTGPTYGLIGEAGPEAIFPLSKINDFMASLPGQKSDADGAGGQFTIRGQDLVLVTNRAQKNLNLVGKPS
jgi:hypothetical protein